MASFYAKADVWVWVDDQGHSHFSAQQVDARYSLFYRAPVRAAAAPGGATDSLAEAGLGWVLGCLLVYSALFGVGSALYGRWPQALLWGVAGLISAAGLARLLPRLWRTRGG